MTSRRNDVVNELSAGRPLEPQHHVVGRSSTLLTDPERDGRLLGVDVWYPALDPADDDVTARTRSRYELFPGVSFASAGALHDPPARSGKFPLIVFSHGRTGMRFAYSLVCEALASRGAIVVSCDHPGDLLTDWLLGTHADDRTNEVNRVGDAHLLIRSMVHGHPSIGVGVLNAVDHDRIVIMGHSYGAYTALATAAGARGVTPHDRVTAIVCFQPYTRIISDSLLGRVTAPTLFVVSELDRATPPDTDAERPWALVRGQPTWRLDLGGAGHQAISDIALYAELAAHVPDLPDIVRQYLAATSADAGAPGVMTWRELMRVQVEAAWAFLDVVLGLDPDRGWAAVSALESARGVELRRR
jgi:predicted dienelactone hydrolase